MNNFDSFPNIYTIYKKHIVTHKRNENNESEVLSDYYKYVPVYGHYFNNNNHFICKRIVAKIIREEVSPHNFLIIKNGNALMVLPFFYPCIILNIVDCILGNCPLFYERGTRLAEPEGDSNPNGVG